MGSLFDTGRFVCFDGEGITLAGRHEYVYLACYDGKSFHDVANWSGLTSEQCFKFLLDNARWNGIHVIYGGSYDANMMLRTLSRKCLEELHAVHRTKWRTWWIDYIPRKYFGLRDGQGRKIRIWDVIGFFQGSFIKSLKLWLDVETGLVAKGKAMRSTFSLAEKDLIPSYCCSELSNFYDLMVRFRECVTQIGLKLHRWDGAGAGASALYKKYNMSEAIGSYKDQVQWYNQAQHAYAGGRFELFMPGDYQEPVYEYDINSAYPHFISQLPPWRPLLPRDGKRYQCGCTASEIHRYDLLHYRYQGDPQSRIHPFFHRDDLGNITNPYKTEGWVWAPEWQSSCLADGSSEVLDVLHWHDNGERPFDWVSEEYQVRLYLQEIGTRSQHALKLFLNSLYGKLAQQKGWQASRPTSSIPWTHNLYMAGWVTASTRAMLYDVMSLYPEKIISCETDAVFSTEKLNLSLGSEMGLWKELVFPEGLSYLQSGIYFGKKDDNELVRCRGIEAGSVTREQLLRAWERMSDGGRSTMAVRATRFRTLGTSLAGERMSTWRQWVQEMKTLSLVPNGKRVHVDPLCAQDQGKRCRWGKGEHHLTYPMGPHGGDHVSKPYSVVWITGANGRRFEQAEEEASEMDILEE